MYSLFYAAELSGIGYAPKTGTKVQKIFFYMQIYFFFLAHLSVVSRSSVGGWVSGDVTAVGVVSVDGGRTQKSGKH